MSTTTATRPRPAGSAPRPAGNRAAGAARPAAASSGTLTHRQILSILVGLMLGMLLAALDQTIVSTAIRTIADDLQGLDMQAWATTAYLITSTLATPLYGKLSDLYGRKPFFLTGISIFLVGSVLCTISTSMVELAVFRAVQGLGAGGLMSLALAILGDIAPPRERAKYQGYFLAVFGTSSVVGPLVGGAFAGAHSILGIAGWRWVFLVNVPLGAVALVVVARVLNIPHTPRRAVIDWFGALALVVAIVPVLLVAEQGRDWGWGSLGSIFCYVTAAVGLVTFVLLERWMGDDALIPMRLFRNPTFTITSIAGVVVGAGMFGGISILPQYLQIARGASPTKSGLLMLPLVLGLMVGSVVSGQITSRTGRYKIFPIVGTMLMVAGAILMSYRIGAHTALWEIDLYMAVFGLGVGNCMQTLTLAAQNAAPARDMGVTTSTSTMFRQLGGTLGTAVFLSVLFSTVADRIADAFATIAPTPGFRAALADPAVRANPANQAVMGHGNPGAVLSDSSFLERMDPRLAEPFLVGFSHALDTVFFVVGCVVVAAWLVLLFMTELPLRNQSGLEARAGELAGEGAVVDPSGFDAVTGAGRVERQLVPALALATLTRHVERGHAGAHLTATLARLAPGVAGTDDDRARVAAARVLRPVAARSLTHLVGPSASAPARAAGDDDPDTRPLPPVPGPPHDEPVGAARANGHAPSH